MREYILILNEDEINQLRDLIHHAYTYSIVNNYDGYTDTIKLFNEKLRKDKLIPLR
jgi:hypothetical protein